MSATIFIGILIIVDPDEILRQAQDDDLDLNIIAHTGRSVFDNQIKDLRQKMIDNPERKTELQAKIDKMFGKLSRKKQLSENPEAFLEGLAAVKTNARGKTYGPGYKTSELKKAQRFLKKPGTALPWIERGPGNVSGRARAILVDPGDPKKDTWFVATVGGGIWKTSDAGQSWQNKTPMLTTLSTTCMAMAPSNPDVIYAGTGMGYGRIVDLSGSGIWKSTDRGETWRQLASTGDGQLLQAINRIVVDPDDENIVLVCSNDGFSYLATKEGQRKSGIFRSTDGGESWTQVFDPDKVLGTDTDNRVQQIIANPKNFNTLYASVNEVGVIKSTDAGKTWFVSADNFALPQDVGTGGNSYQGISIRSELAISPTDTSRLYAAVERRYGTADLYMTKNAGASWILVNDTGNDPNWFSGWGISGADGAYTAGWFDNTIEVHPYNENIVFIGGVELYMTDVNPGSNSRRTQIIGQHYAQVPTVSYVHGDHHWLSMIPVNEVTGHFRIINANDGGIAVSNDGGQSWQQITGMGSTQFYGVDKKPSQNVYIGGMQDNGTWYSSPNPQAGSPWNPALRGDGIEVVWNYKNPDLVLGCSQNNNLSRSDDGGRTWYPLPNASSGDAPFLTKIGNSKTDPDLIFTVNSNGIKRSDDFGTSWTFTPVPGNWFGWRAFDNVEVGIADPQIVWISSRLAPDTYYQSTGGIYVSQDGGLGFNNISRNFPTNVTESSGIGLHPVNAGTAYFLFSAPDNPKVLRTRDYGNSFEDISGFGAGSETSSNGFPDVAVFSFLVMPYDTDILWAGTEIGLFISDDNGISWQYSNNGLPAAGIFQMTIVDGQIVIATQGRGIWSANLPELAGYKPPAATLSPRLNQMAMTPEGQIPVTVNLRSAYDSTTIYMNGQAAINLGPNDQPVDTTLVLTATVPEKLTFEIISLKNQRTYKSAVREVDVFPLEAKSSYSDNFNSPETQADYSGQNFSITTADGISSPAIHSDHPYADGQEMIAMIKTPIVVAENNAIVTYNDIALVEPGDPGTVYGDQAMWDYVVIEGTTDGLNWLPLIDGYDARANQSWLSAYQNRTSPQSGMYVSHSINLLDTFTPGDVIFIRFRLFARSGRQRLGLGNR